MHQALSRLHEKPRTTAPRSTGSGSMNWSARSRLVGAGAPSTAGLSSLAGVRPGNAVLDVGCSSGYLARKLAAAAGPTGRVTGVDPAVAAIASATRRAAGSLTFTVGVAQRLPLGDQSCDVVTCTLALHHVPARQRASGPLGELAAGAGYRVEAEGRLSLLRYVQAVRP